MKTVSRKNMFCLSLMFLNCITTDAFALTEAVKKLVWYETKANAVSERLDTAIPLPHVEIPIEEVGVDFARRLDPRVASSLIFQREGKQFVRWILNPEDTVWGNELIQHFKNKGILLEVKHHFTGYQTASRSYIAEDPKSGAQFSVKSSTNITGGAWRDKKQPIGEAKDARLVADFLAQQNRLRKFENFTFMDEPAIMSVSALDQAVVIRDLGPLKDTKKGRLYLPGFSALHERVGAEIAKHNGFADPHLFWTENYIKVAGRALGELAARTGMQFDSPHSQNFLIELDENLKPTGKLVLRDMSDLYVDTTFIKAIDGEDSEFLKKFSQAGNLKNAIAAGFGPLHGNKKPSWVTELMYRFWKDDFFREFEKSFFETSGHQLDTLKSSWYQSGDYYGASYKLTQAPDHFRPLLVNLAKTKVVTNRGGALRCDLVHLGASN